MDIRLTCKGLKTCRSSSWFLGCDPFDQMIFKKKSHVLKPIQHRRVVSDSKNGTNNEKAKEVLKITVPKTLESPRVSPQEFFRLYPDFQNLTKAKLPNNNSPANIRKEARKIIEPPRPSKISAVLNILDSGTFKGNYLVAKDNAISGLEFSFGIK